MENFIREQNILRFSDRLQTEGDPSVRKQLSKLLLDEENKFAACAERLDKTDRHIVDCKAHITRQYGLIDKLKVDGHDIAAAEGLLRNLMELHDLFVSHRQGIVAALEQEVL
jgi:hypothetical protein